MPIMFCLSLGLVIYAIAMGTLNVGARYFAMMLTREWCLSNEYMHANAQRSRTVRIEENREDGGC